MTDGTSLVEQAACEWYRWYQAVQEKRCPRCDEQQEQAACICIEPLAALDAAEKRLAEAVRLSLSEDQQQ